MTALLLLFGGWLLVVGLGMALIDWLAGRDADLDGPWLP